MSILSNVKELPMEISFLIAQNEKIQQLLVNDSADCLNQKMQLLPIAELLAKNYISFSPVIDLDRINKDRNSSLRINLQEISFSSDSVNFKVYGDIYIVVNESQVMLNNNHERALEIADILLELLENKKFSTAGFFHCRSVESVVFNDFVYGYRISFRITDQDNERNDF